MRGRDTSIKRSFASVDEAERWLVEAWLFAVRHGLAPPHLDVTRRAGRVEITFSFRNVPPAIESALKDLAYSV